MKYFIISKLNEFKETRIGQSINKILRTYLHPVYSTLRDLAYKAEKSEGLEDFSFKQKKINKNKVETTVKISCKEWQKKIIKSVER